MKAKKKYAFVGTGGRVVMFLHPLVKTYAATGVPVAFCDPSSIRMRYHRDLLAKDFGFEGDIACYAPDDFDRMLFEQKPDVLVVCSIDVTHADYVIRGLKAGCDVVVEKPLAITAEQCRAIQDAAETSPASVRVAFNYRWAPGATKVKELLASGTIGRIQHVQMEYLLNTHHGADYFRRWHAIMANSGGLLVHKSTHHFDLINWWLDTLPESVYAQGRLAYYGRENALRRGDERLVGYERYTGSEVGDDPFAIDLSDPKHRGLYFDAEKDSGYIRDKNVFRDDIDIYDTMGVTATYRNQAVLSYSLVAYAPYEGFRVTFTGDRGRLEYSEVHGSHLIMGQSEDELAAAQSKIPEGMKEQELKVFPHFQSGYEVEIPPASGGHGGGDPLIQEQIFSADPPEDPWGRSAGWEQGLASVLMGIAANASIASGLPVQVSDQVSLRPETDRLSQLI